MTVPKDQIPSETPTFKRREEISSETPTFNRREEISSETPTFKRREEISSETPTFKRREEVAPDKPRDLMALPVAPGTVSRTVALRDPSTYTSEELESPTRALLARTVGVEDRLAKSDLWWKKAYEPRSDIDYVEHNLRYPKKQFTDIWGDKDFFYYGGAPSLPDVKGGWAREATPEEKERDAALLEKRGLDMAPPEYAWKNEESRAAAMKFRFNEKALREDLEEAGAFVDERTQVLGEEQALLTEIQAEVDKVLLKYNDGEDIPAAEDAVGQAALLRRIAEEATEEEKELIQYGHEYGRKVGGLLEERLAEREEGFQILEQLQKTGWVKSRRKMEEKETEKILSEAKRDPEDIAQSAVSSRLVKGPEGLLVPSTEKVASYEDGTIYLEKEQGVGEEFISKVGPLAGEFAAGPMQMATRAMAGEVLGGEDFIGSGLWGAAAELPFDDQEAPTVDFKGTTFRGLDFQELAQDPARYQEEIERAAGDLNADLVRSLIEHKRAVGILKAYEASDMGSGIERDVILQGQRPVVLEERRVDTATPAASRRAAEKWAREVVFYREVLQHTERRVKEDLGAAGEFAGLSAEAMGQVALSRKLYGEGNETAFDYGPALDAIQSHQENVISEFFGIEDHFQAAQLQQTVEEFTNGDLSKLQYTYVDSDGRTVEVGSPPSNKDENIAGYISSVAMQRAKKIIKQDLAKGRKMIFVKSQTSEERQRAAQASGVPFLYMMLPRGPDTELTVTPKGEIWASGEFFEEYSVMDHTMQVFNGFTSYGGALGKELWRTGTVDDVSSFLTTGTGDINWAGLGLQQYRQHAVRRGETLEEIARYYWGDEENWTAQAWIERQREELGLSEGHQPPVGTTLTIHRDVEDVFRKARAVAMGATDIVRARKGEGEGFQETQLWAEMDRRSSLVATEQMLELAEWSAEGIDLSSTKWALDTLLGGAGSAGIGGGDFDLSTKTAVLGTLAIPAGVYLDVRAPDPFTGTLVVGGKSIQALKAVRQSRQFNKTVNELRSVTDDATDFDSLMANLERINPGADVYFQSRVAHAMGVDENISKQLLSLEKQLERERLLLRKSEVDAEELTLEADKANARSRMDSVSESIAELEHQRFVQQRDIVRGQIDALEKMGARKALEQYQKEVAAAGVAEHHKDLAISELKAHGESPAYIKYKEGVGNWERNLQTATEGQLKATETLKQTKENVRAVTSDLRVQKRVLNEQLRELKAEQRLELNVLDAEFAAKSFDLPRKWAEWVARAERAGLSVDMRHLPDNLKTWKQTVTRAEKAKGAKGHLEGDPTKIKDLDKELRKAARTRKKEAIARKNTDKEALKKRHSREKSLVEEELKLVRDDLNALTWTKRSSEKRSSGSRDIELLRSNRDTAANRLTAAIENTKSVRERSRSFLKDSEGIVKKHRKKAVKANRAAKAHARLTGRAFAKLSAYAPGLAMGVVTKKSAIDILENTLADLQRAEKALDNEIAAVKTNYKSLLQTRKEAKLSLREADKRVDELVKNSDRQARLLASTRGLEERQEVWRTIALKMADEMETGNPLLKRLPDESPRYEDPLARGTVKVDTKSGERVIDPKKLREGLDEKFGSDAVEHFLRSEPEMSLPLKDLLRRSGEVTVSGDKVTTLQQMQAGLLRAREAVHPQAEAIATVRAIAQAKGDIDMMHVAMSSSNGWKSAGRFAMGFLGMHPDWWPTRFASFSRAMDPIKNRVGPISGEQALVLKGADMGAAIRNEDMRLISREAHGGALPGGADGVVIEAFSAKKRVEGSRKAVEMYTDLVDGAVKEVSTRPLRQVERPELIASLETEIKALSKELEEVERKIKLEREIPGETLFREELESTARSMLEKKKVLEDLQAKERALIERTEAFRREIFVEANGLRTEAAALEAAGLATDVDHVVFTHYTAAIAAREAGDMGVFERKMLSAAEASGKFSKEELVAFKDRLRRSSSTQAQESSFVFREKGARIGAGGMEELQRPGKMYRGMTSAEYEATVAQTGQVQSRQDWSVPGEGTSFAEEIRDAESYVNFGRTDPRTTGVPTYIVESHRGKLPLERDGYIKAQEPVRAERVWRISAEDDALVGTLVRGQAPAEPTFRVFSTSDETLLRNAAGEAEKRLFEPDRLRAQADELQEGLDQGTHPRQDVFNDLRTRQNAATEERVLAETERAGLKERLDQLHLGLPEDLRRTLTGRQQVTRLQHDLKQAEERLALREKDVQKTWDEIDAVEIQISEKGQSVIAAVETAQAERAALSPRVIAGDKDAVLEMAEIDLRLDALLKERSIFARETPGGWKSNLSESNPMVKKETALYDRRDLLDNEISRLSRQIEDDLRPAYSAAIKEHGWTSGTTTAEHMLRSKKKELLQKKADAEALLKDNSAKPSWREVDDFLSSSAQGEDLGHLFAQLILAETRVTGARASLEAVPGEIAFHEQMLQVATNQKRADLAALLQKALPKPGKVSTVDVRVANARAMSELLAERPLLDSLLETSKKLSSAEAHVYGAAADRLAKEELKRAGLFREHAAAKEAYDARRKALLAGDEPLPLGDRSYSTLVTKKNIPIRVAGRTTASNTGLQVPWDEAVHQWRATDLQGLDAKISAAAQVPGHFGNALKASGVSEAFMGLSRMWVPRKTQLTQYHQSKLLGDAAKILAREDVYTFAQFADQMRAATFKSLKDATGHVDITAEHWKTLAAQTSVLEHEHSIAMGVYNVLRGSLLKQTNDNIIRTIGATFTDEQARAMNAFLGAEKGIRSVPEGAWGDVIEGLNRLGTPLTQTYVRPAKGSGLGETTTRLVASGATDDGAKIWARQDLVQAIDGVFSEATKRADRFYRADITEGLPVEHMKNASTKAYNFWKQSVTSGLILPNPGYWMNNVVGDFSQMYFTVGLGTAMKLSTNNLPTNIPIMGKYWNDWGASMAKGTEKVPMLGTLTNALFNPHLARIWNRQPGHVVFKGGQTASYDDLYRWSVEDGILDSVIQEEFLGLLKRTQTSKVTSAFDGSKKVLGNWQEDILLFADFAQKRQRMGLYVELLKQGYSRNEARRLTLEALYDWRHGIAQWEAALITKVSPFWRFWKNALKQAGRVVTDPLTKPDKAIQEMLASGLGGTQAGAGAAQRMRQAMILEEKGPPALYEAFGGDESESMVTIEQGVKDAEVAARHFIGSYLYDYMFYGTSTLTPEERAFYDTERRPLGLGGYEDKAGVVHGFAPGRSRFPTTGDYDAEYAHTHKVAWGPKWSTVEAMSMWATLSAWFVAGTYSARQSVLGADEDAISDDLIEDFLLKPALKLSGPHSQLALEGLASWAGLEEPAFSISGRFQHYSGGTSSSLSPAEAWTLSMFPGTEVKPKTVFDDKGVERALEGKYESSNKFAVYTMRNFPFLMQLPTKVNQAYFQNPDIQNGLFPALWTGAQQVGALPFREKAFDPRYSIEGRKFDIRAAMMGRQGVLSEEEREIDYAAESKAKKAILEENAEIIEGTKTIPRAIPPPEVDDFPAFPGTPGYEEDPGEE